MGTDSVFGAGVAASAPALSIIIPTCRRPASLAIALAALAAQHRPPPFEIIVVNDASHDAAYDAVIAAPPRPVTYVRLPRRSGPAAARNAGAARARADILVFTDDDCVPPPDWLAAVHSAFTGSTLDSVGGPAIPLPIHRPSLPERYLLATDFLQAPTLDNGLIVCLPTANFAVRRSAFERVRGFDARFPKPGGEDTNFLYRLRAAGFSAAFFPELATSHDSRCGWRALLRRHYNYGFGNSQHLAYTPDRLYYGLLRSRSRLRLLAHARAILHWARQSPRLPSPNPADPLSLRLAFKAIALASEIAYQIGGVDGLRYTQSPAPRATTSGGSSSASAVTNRNDKRQPRSAGLTLPNPLTRPEGARSLPGTSVPG